MEKKRYEKPVVRALSDSMPAQGELQNCGNGSVAQDQGITDPFGQCTGGGSPSLDIGNTPYPTNCRDGSTASWGGCNTGDLIEGCSTGGVVINNCDTGGFPDN